MNQEAIMFDKWREPNITIQDMFKLAVSANPDALALTESGVSLTYADLDKLTDDLAVYLKANGVGQGAVVGIYLEKCHQYIIACLAILKTGAAYLHLDLEYSTETLKKIMVDTDPIVVISKSKHLAAFPESNSRLIVLDEDTDWNPDNFKLMAVPMSSGETAFIGYSSGTTGIPKGVKVTHLAAVYSMSKFWEEVWHYKNIMDFGYATYLSWDAMSPLLFGATAHIIPEVVSNNLVDLTKYIKQRKINHIFFTPSLLKAIFQEVAIDTVKSDLVGLMVIWIGGEVTTGDLVEEVYDILPTVHLINNYGPSECFVVTQGELTINDAGWALCPAGNVLPEMEVLILDQDGRPTPSGLPGELYVSGPCLVEGYLNNPQLTEEKFLEIGGKKYYKTGDLASFIPDGRIIIHGRADFLIKINGRPVNLLEVQHSIISVLPFADCVVVGEEDQKDNKYLVCYYIKTPNSEQQIDVEQAKKMLRPVLEADLIPRKFLELKKMPISNTSKKLNYKKLHNLK